MKKEKDELTDLFCSRLENVELSVRSTLWESLEKEVPVMMHRRKLVIQRIAAAASVLLVLAGTSAAFWYLSPQKEISEAFNQVAVSSTPKSKLNADAVRVELPAINDAPVTKGGASAAQPVTNVEEEEEYVSVSVSMSFSFSATEERINDGNRRQYTFVKSQERTSDQPNEEEQIVSSAEREVAKERKWSLGVVAATGLSASEENIKYKMPLSLGVTVRRKLSDVVSLESGLLYTRLHSEQMLYDGMKEDQTLHTIGIPLKANVKLHDGKKVNVYATGGGMIEKTVSGPTDAFQASLLAGVGVEYKLNDRLSLYAEPGMGYHFDNGSSVASLRKEKPLNLNLLCGVRMTY